MNCAAEKYPVQCRPGRAATGVGGFERLAGLWAGARPMSLYIELSLTLMKVLLDETCFLQSIKAYQKVI